MKYQDLKPTIKRSINGSLFYQFDSGCLDFKGVEEAFLYGCISSFMKVMEDSISGVLEEKEIPIYIQNNLMN